MKIKVYYVVRIYNKGSIHGESARMDSGPHSSYDSARETREYDHRWDHEKYNILESFIEGELV